MVELAGAKQRFEVVFSKGRSRHGDSPYFRFIFAILDRTWGCKPPNCKAFGLRYGLRNNLLAQAQPSLTPVDTNGTTPPKGLRRLAAALQHRDFRVLWFGACASSIGTWMQSLAENWLVLSLTASAFFLGLDAFLQQLPIMLFTLIGGVVADRHDRRLTLMASQWVQLSTAAILAALVYFRLIEIWHILLLSFITGTAQAFGGPAYQSLIPSLVGKKDLTNAIALNSIQFNVARMVGPLLAGATLAAFKRGGVEEMTAYAACFTLNALSFLVVIVSLMSLHIKHMPAPRTHNMMGELRQGLVVRPRRAQHHGAHGARRGNDVFRHSDADAAAGVCERRLRTLTSKATVRCSPSRARARSSDR